MFVLYYIECDDDEGKVTLIKASEDLDKLNQIQQKLIAGSTKKSNEAAKRQQEIYYIYDQLKIKVKEFLSRNKHAIKNGPLHISNTVWATAHQEIKDHMINQSIENGKFVGWFFPENKNRPEYNLENLLFLDKITDHIPELGQLPPRIEYPNPSYYKDNLLIEHVEVI